MMKFAANLGASVALAVIAGTAQAAACTGIDVGTSATGDFKLGGVDSTACVISGVNPDQGPNGNSSGFSPSPFGTGWVLLAKMTSSSSPTFLDGVNYDWGITFNTGNKSGGWSFGADQSVKLDLVIAMHASDHSGAFLFDDLTLTAHQTQQGSWAINWLNNGGRVPGYSNSSLWVRDVTAVPEPQTYALLLAGLAALGFVARRRTVEARR